MRSALVVTVLVLALSACADETPSGTEESAVDETSQSPTPDEVTPSTPTGSATPTEPPPGSDSPAVRQSVTDLAATLGVGASEVEVLAVEEVTWRDGSRGCARRGMMYTQALIDGSRITLGVEGTTYEYHSGGSGPPALCARPTQ